jgi:hypothetical protein
VRRSVENRRFGVVVDPVRRLQEALFDPLITKTGFRAELSTRLAAERAAVGLPEELVHLTAARIHEWGGPTSIDWDRVSTNRAGTRCPA